MKTARIQTNGDRYNALRALKMAFVEGATWRYDHLVGLAMAAGVTDVEIDLMTHDALEALLAGAEKPLTAQQLAHERPAGAFRP